MGTWTFTDAGTLGGGGYQESHAFGLNEAGVGVGESDNAQSKAHACRFAGLPPEDLSPVAEGGRAYAIANGSPERVVGIADHHAMLWEDGVATDLHPQLVTHFGPVALSDVRGVNDAGLVAGHADMHTFTLDVASQTITEIPLPAGSSGVAQAVNAAGHVVGTWSDSATTFGFFYDGATVTDLGPGVDAHDLNDADIVVGSNVEQAFLWTPANGMQDLTALSGLSNAFGINNAGDISGQIGQTADGQPHAALWDGAQLVDLNDFGPGGDWILREATAINQSRRIFGTALHKENARAFMLSPAAVTGSGFETLGVIVAQILFGVVQDGGGFVIVGPHGHPIGPWDPLKPLSSAQRDVLVGLAIQRLGEQISDPEARQQAEAGGLFAVRSGVDRLVKRLGGELGSA